MTYRLTSPRAVLAIVAMLVSASPLAAAVRRRSVSMPKPATQNVKLTGQVTDATTGAPVVKALVSASGRSATTDAAGRFTLEFPSGRSIALSISRTGYKTLTTALTLTADTTQNFALAPGATVTVRMSSGAATLLDFETVEFGYIAPFAGFTKDTKMNLCKAGGEAFTPDRTEIHRITPAAQINDSACCSRGPVPAVTVELKSGGTTTGALADACFGYQVDIIGLRHDTAELVNLHFSDVTEIVFP